MIKITESVFHPEAMHRVAAVEVEARANMAVDAYVGRLRKLKSEGVQLSDPANRLLQTEGNQAGSVTATPTGEMIDEMITAAVDRF
jgi:ribosomal protein S16